MSYTIKTQTLQFNRPKTPIKPLGVVIHETATPGATAQNEFDYYNGGNRSASAHFFVDWNEIVNTIPVNEKAWHAGKTANANYIGVELCHPKVHNVEQFKEVWKRGVWLFAKLLLDLQITKANDQTMPSHYDITYRYHETNHVDPVGYFAEYGKTVQDFRNDVQSKINEVINMYSDMEQISDWALKQVQALKNAGIMQGDSANNFNPKQNITREEMAVLMFNILKYIGKEVK